MPLGRQTFADVPFEVIDPARNNWKSILVLGDTKKEARLPGSVIRAEIPVGRKAASLCVLRCYLRNVFRAGQTSHYYDLLTPAYVLEYADGSRCLCDREVRRDWDDVTFQCFYYGNHLGTSPLDFLLPQCRVACMANTLSGAGATLYMNEFVNPYPDQEIKRLIVQLPNPEQNRDTFEFHDAIFALTGVEPTPWDVKFWGRQKPWPRLPPNPALPANAEKVAGAQFRGVEHAALPTYQCNLAKPGRINALSFRLAMPWRDNNPMTVRDRHADCKVRVSADQKTWKEVGSLAGCTGMDGEHRVVFTPAEAVAIQFVMDPSAYPDEESSEIGLLAADVYAER